MLELERQPQAFRLEYKESTPEQRLREDIRSYLGEYRFKIPKHKFNLVYRQGLRDPITGELMSDITKKAVEDRIWSGLSPHREVNEVKAALSLDQQLELAPDGIYTIFFASPPPYPAEPGYGTHGFINYGRVVKSNDRIRAGPMTAARIEGMNLVGSNNFLSRVKCQRVDFSTVDEVLASPVVVPQNFREDQIDKLLGEIFHFDEDSTIKLKAEKVLKKLDPWIDRFVGAVKIGAPELTRKLFNVIENLSIKYMNEDPSLTYLDDWRTPREIIRIHGNQAEQVPGSCPPNMENNIRSSNILGSRFNSLNSALGEPKWFVCPNCGYEADGPVGNSCPKDKGGCGITKDKFAKNGGKVC